MAEEKLSGISEFSLGQACEWLEERKVNYDDLEELDEMKDLIRKIIKEESVNGDVRWTEMTEDGKEETEHVQRNGSPRPKMSTKNTQEMMQAILEKDRQMKKELSQIYENLMKFVASDMVGKGIKEILSEKYGDHALTICGYMRELNEEECPIVVAGETGAGKSSLLNLLLGTNVLPNSLLCTTSTICRLHNSQQRKLEVDGEAVDFTDGESFHDKLTSIVSLSGDDRGTSNSCKLVDIYLPIPMIQDPVTIVDTPGIGESDEMTKRLMNYLPNAVAFIYVINSAVAGGIQEDRLLHILNEQRRWEKEGKMSTFDQSCAIFVCNKWDQVEVTHEAENVWTDTLAKLKKAWPSLTDDQVFMLDCKKAARYQNNKIGNTDMFQKLLDGIEKMVPASLGAKVKRHYIWIEKFIRTLEVSISSRLNHARTTEQEKKTLQEEVMNRLHHLKKRSDDVREKLQNAAKRRCKNIADELFLYMHSDETRNKLGRWNVADIPKMSTDDLEVTRYNADKAIVQRIQDEFVQWESQTQNIKDLSASLTKKFCEECRILNEECLEIDSMLTKSGTDVDLEKSFPSPLHEDDSPLFSFREKAILIATSPLWIPLVVSAALVFMPVGIGMRIKESVDNSKRRKAYEHDKEGHMRKWTEEFLHEKFTHSVVSDLVNDQYYTDFSRNIDKMCNEVIPRRVAADEKLVFSIATDMRSSKEIINQFLPLQNDVKRLVADFLHFGMKYMIDDRVAMETITEKECIGKGSYSDVYLVEWNSPDGMIEAAMKVLRRPLRDDMYAQLSEVDILRTLKHENIVQLLGVGFRSMDTRNSQSDCIVMLMEHCEDSLEQLVFNKQALQCKRFPDKNSRHAAFGFYVSMATGICAGLAHIHDKRYVHRDLKLSNILVKNDVVKVCDVGFTRRESLMTGTCVGTVTHMAPELYQMSSYNFKADIYSMGILMWELWYAEHAYSDQRLYGHLNNLALLEAVVSGTRPLLMNKYVPYKELSKLMNKCWQDDPQKRPTAVGVSEELVEIYDSYYDDNRFSDLKKQKCHQGQQRQTPGGQLTEVQQGSGDKGQSVSEEDGGVIYTRGQTSFDDDGSFSVQYTRLDDVSD